MVLFQNGVGMMCRLPVNKLQRQIAGDFLIPSARVRSEILFGIYRFYFCFLNQLTQDLDGPAFSKNQIRASCPQFFAERVQALVEEILSPPGGAAESRVQNKNR